MIITRSYFLVSITVGIFFLAIGSVDSAYATDFVISDNASCVALPGNGDSWDGPTSTCSKTKNLAIGALDTLTVPNGVTLEFPSNNDLKNSGIITNNGIISFSAGGDIVNKNSATFTNMGIILLDSTAGNTGRLTNKDTAIFTNTVSGSITLNGLDGTDINRAQLKNKNSASFTNAGTITISGIGSSNSDNSGQLRNESTADFTNSGTITIEGTIKNSGQLRNLSTASFTNSGTIILTGDADDSALVRNHSVLTNSGSLTTNSKFDNNKANSEIINSGTIQVTLHLNNNNGLIVNDCGEITFGSISGNPIQEESCPPSSPTGSTIPPADPIKKSKDGGSSSAYVDPTIGKSKDGKQVVENGICIDITCWTVIEDYHQDFELVEMLSDSIHTISTTVFCQQGVNKCNYAAFGVSPYGTNINDSVWKIILQKDHRDNWTMKVIDPDGYLGEVTSTTQIVNDGRHLSASVTIEFKKPTPGMILNIEVRDSGGGYRDFKFNDGIEIVDAYAYPSIETSYEYPLEIESLCLYENPNKRYTCAFAKIREQTLIDAAIAYDEIMDKK